MKNRNDVYATLTTNFGARNLEFIPSGEKEFKTVRPGIAHFLEHKMFEMENGKDPFELFNSRGADANANTDYSKTTYLFKAPDKLKENLNLLLDYVQKPYFTDKNVEKEKGIIDQERSMYQDDPFWRMLEGCMANLFIEDDSKHSIVGTKSDIYAMNKEDLYACYNTFYHPSNMFLIVTGNVNKDDVFDIVSANQAKKKFPRLKKIVLKEFDEPLNVKSISEEALMDITVNNVCLGFKIDIRKHDKFKAIQMINLFMDSKLGDTSLINEKLKKDGILTEDISLDLYESNGFLIYFLFAETKKTAEFMDIVHKELASKKVLKSDFERKKKSIIGSSCLQTETVTKVNHILMSQLVNYGKVLYNYIDIINSISFEEFNDFMEDISFTNYSSFVINPLKK
jgi:predicted Zn-dependent peptidase